MSISWINTGHYLSSCLRKGFRSYKGSRARYNTTYLFCDRGIKALMSELAKTEVEINTQFSELMINTPRHSHKKHKT
jgi:hypothetical protein